LAAVLLRSRLGWSETGWWDCPEGYLHAHTGRFPREWNASGTRTGRAGIVGAARSAHNRLMLPECEPELAFQSGPIRRGSPTTGEAHGGHTPSARVVCAGRDSARADRRSAKDRTEIPWFPPACEHTLRPCGCRSVEALPAPRWGWSAGSPAPAVPGAALRGSVSGQRGVADRHAVELRPAPRRPRLVRGVRPKDAPPRARTACAADRRQQR
jgi:hypothetical protein